MEGGIQASQLADRDDGNRVLIDWWEGSTYSSCLVRLLLFYSFAKGETAHSNPEF